MSQGEIAGEVANVNVNGSSLRLHYLRAGKGPLIVLLHGWPQTSHCWRHVIPELARTHTVVAPDLRGYGRTDKPATGYDKRTMAADIAQLVEKLGFEKVIVIGHDRGARVAHRWALDRPDQVERLVLMDILPTREVLRHIDFAVTTGYWHWWFHLQPDLPERLVGNDVAGYLGYFFEKWTYNRHGLPASAIEEYVRAFSAPGALRAGFSDYRASFPTDLNDDDASSAAGVRLKMPLLLLWGSESFLQKIPVLDIWSAYATDVRGQMVPECGHFLPEERPAEVLTQIRAFL
ncbi:alpha/beta fold hydrolase [Pendulispora albinea]|uniref:Alpha/beta hydrolase n=1 Tax=Pendulispora albinea TaxID=2741071 RepID=A0ABZ2M187_9BACT